MRCIYSFVLLFVVVLADAQGLYDPNRHTPGPNRGWISCTPAANPNTRNGTGHWIMYDFGQKKSIKGLQFWNLNETDRLTDGLKRASIEISDNGSTWESIGDFSIEMGNGSSYYCGISIEDLEPFQSRFLLINAIENHGGTCYGLSEVKFMLSNSSLPITYIDQSVTCNESGGRAISWVTEQEFNNDYYAIQSSKDGLSWETIKKINGKNNREQYTYKWTHEDRGNQQLYYRIQQFDNDGRKTTFEMMSSCCDGTQEVFSVWPNPVLENLHVNYLKRSNSPAFLKILDMQGKIIKQHIIEMGQEYYQDRFSLKTLKEGNYVLVIQENGTTTSKKIQKL
jgi:hypothetical protein